MKALLLIGGLATRLYPLTRHQPKSLLPICDRELLHYQITQLAKAGISEIVLAAGAHVEQLTSFVANYSGGLSFIVSEEAEPLGTAGAIAQAVRLLDNEPVLVLNADILSSLNITNMLRAHADGNRPATLCGYAVEDPSRYGLLNVADGQVTGFTEKPQSTGGDAKHYINAGVYVLEPEVYRDIPQGRPVSIEREVFPQLIERAGALTHYAHSGLWIDVGTFESYFAANFILLARRYTEGEDWLWGVRSDAAVFKDLVFVSHSCQLGRSVELFHRVILMRQVSIGSGCHLRNCLVLPNARIGDNCRLTDVIVGPDVEVADGSRLANLVLVAGEKNTAFFPHSMAEPAAGA